MCKSLKATYTFNHKIKLRDCSHIMSSQRGADVFVCVCVGGVGGGGGGGMGVYLYSQKTL